MRLQEESGEEWGGGGGEREGETKDGEGGTGGEGDLKKTEPPSK